jgi:hypothetical protein
VIELSHPYRQYEKTGLWNIVESVIDELVENQDLIENTPRPYIVGYICKRLSEACNKGDIALE